MYQLKLPRFYVMSKICDESARFHEWQFISLILDSLKAQSEYHQKTRRSTKRG
jgi:hypothetical protein